MESYVPPPSSVPPPDFRLRMALPHGIPVHRTPLHPVNFLLRAACVDPNKYGIVHPEREFRFTYVQWAARILSLAFALRATPNWKEGDRCAVIAPNTPLILEAYNAVPAIGGIIVPCNIRNTKQEIEYVLNHSGATVILLDSAFAHLVDANNPGSSPDGRPRTVIVSNDTGRLSSANGLPDPYEHFLMRGRELWTQTQLDADAETARKGLPMERARRDWEHFTLPKDEEIPIVLSYTSGTTGRPKGVLTSARGSYLAAVSNVFEATLTTSSVYLWVLACFHAAGWCLTWAVNAAIATHYILRKVDNAAIWTALTDGGITHYAGAPTVQIGIVNHPTAKRLPQKVRVLVAASAPTAQLLGQMEALNLEPVHVYGLTETYGPSVRRYANPAWANLSVDARARLQARQGHAYLASDEVRVLRRPDPSKAGQGQKDDDDDHLVDVRSDGVEMGEIATRGNLAMLGYYNDTDATSKVVRGRSHAGSWFLTGDLAVRMPGGEVMILDRGKDIIISGGENISSLNVETELATHPAVMECCVVAAPHPRWQEVPHAFVVLKTSVSAVSEDELRKHCVSRMSKFAVPAKFEIIGELPKNSTGKILKAELRKQLLAAADKAKL
ncbi:hypothetical protein CF327_g3201 [Tilletia walkeri]|uniref:Acetyl-CoA synthetase-like protein n=1 Tax=Tilletia walkeri TaxID=117179 RepID=A0A8X7T1T3_9BASI|nr:hypothetical protein CF327_g3201 [Tilletia walkeri]KAE8264163.1 hypothetical protein A4X09_0g7044 [Tilletia walkeri]